MQNKRTSLRARIFVARLLAFVSRPVAALRVGLVVAALLLGIVGLGIVLGASTVSAQGGFDCDSPVVDDGAEIDVDQVVEAINQTSNDGPIYIVRSFDTVPDGDLDGYIDELVAACFTASDGEIVDETILLAVSRGDRLSLVEVGDTWGRPIPGSEQDRIRSEVMSPKFADGDFTGGLVDGIFAADQLLGDVVGGSSNANAEASETPSGTERKPDNRITFYAILGALGLIVVGAAVFGVVNSRRKLRSARQSLEKSLAGPRLKIGALRERFDRLTGQADVWERTTAGKTKLKLRTLVRESGDTQKDAERDAALLTDIIPQGVENGSMNELRRARTAGVTLSKSLESHELELDRLTAFGAHLDHLRIALPTKKELLIEEVVETELLRTSREDEGWAIDDVRSTLVGIEQSLRGVSFEDLELDLLSLSVSVEQAEADLFATAHYLHNLPNQLESLKTWESELDSAAELELARIDSLRKELSIIAQDHASSSWDWAVDNPDHALEQLELAHQRQEVAVAEQIPAQQLDEAGESLERAGLHLIRADGLLDEVDDLLIDLQQAKLESPALLDQAEEILRDLTRFVSSNSADLDPTFQNEPSKFSTALSGIQTELTMERPNYLRVAESLDRINRRLDEALAVAHDAQARTQALKREADREVARADRTLRRAERALGWEIFPSKDGQALERLREALHDLPSNPQQKIVVASNIADGAIQIQERIIARRRRRTAWATTGSGGGFGSGWSSGSGSSGSGWSGGGGRSTGGRSFGGGVSRGGRSFGGGRSSGSF